ncbi:dual specificity phosphatase [Wuchereria bancrofti]|uniref:protein-tyrosine-phosphatase n=1 Tax=Wuchereria bancrofti TaxID=6293 RepID=J9EVC5_WUCBA|nr:dual specificity phosphatase [Wuchereria bancrofti]
MIDRIIENLYLSDVQDVLNEFRINRLKNELKISHILTVAAESIPVEKQIVGISYTFIYALDTDTQDMFADDLLANALMFIRTSFENNGRILVHCEAGISRSVFVVAAYLMQKLQWSSTKAVEYIQRIRPIALPNDSFMRQLQIFESCHFIADIQIISQCPLYKNWLLNISSASSARFSLHEKLSYSIDSTWSNVEYRCRKCRKILFNDKHIIRHRISTSRNVTDDEETETMDCGFGYFISPMDWMSLNEHRGKISCSCNEKLGHYDWGGRVCEGMTGRPCGTADYQYFELFEVMLEKKPK